MLSLIFLQIFSQNVATAEDIDKVPATITYSANKKSVTTLLPTIMKSAAQSLQKELRASVTEQITGNLVQQLNSVRVKWKPFLKDLQHWETVPAL